jgi:hypothetical protein
LAAEALRGLIEGIEIHPGKRRGEVSVVLRGDLAALLEATQTHNALISGVISGRYVK